MITMDDVNSLKNSSGILISLAASQLGISTYHEDTNLHTLENLKNILTPTRFIKNADLLITEKTNLKNHEVSQTKIILLTINNHTVNYLNLINLFAQIGFHNYFSVNEIDEFELIKSNSILLQARIKGFIFIADILFQNREPIISNLLQPWEEHFFRIIRTMDRSNDNAKIKLGNKLTSAFVDKRTIVSLQERITLLQSIKGYAAKYLFRSNNHNCLFHITHWKAGSQWIYKILKQCDKHRTFTQNISQENFLKGNILAGKIYPTLYITYEQYTKIIKNKSINAIPLIIFRDIRDTLISLYFSTIYSHELYESVMIERRKKLLEYNVEDGLLYLIDNALPPVADIQKSWLNLEYPVLKYEDLIVNDIKILTPILNKHLDIKTKKIKGVILRNRFENSTKGRKRGNELITSHERKASPGEWKFYFTDKIKNRIKESYNPLLRELKYIDTNDW